VWGRGQVCVGNSALPGEEAKDDPSAWTAAFFGSHFTHPNFTEADRLMKGSDPCTFWKRHLTSGAKSFPEAVLVEAPVHDGGFDRQCKLGDLLDLDVQQKLSSTRTPKGEF
jgi:PRTRC genetic system protein B